MTDNASASREAMQLQSDAASRWGGQVSQLEVVLQDHEMGVAVGQAEFHFGPWWALPDPRALTQKRLVDSASVDRGDLVTCGETDALCRASWRDMNYLQSSLCRNR